jgi:hypothetical protein
MESFNESEFRKELLQCQASELKVVHDDPTDVKAAINQEVIGSGAEKVAFNHPYDQDKVVAIYRDRESLTGKEARMKYWLQKILHLLYEDKIPDIHAIYTSPAAQVVEKINKPTSTLPRVRAQVLGGLEKRALGSELIPLGIHIDSNDRNFVFNEKGIPVYVDGFYFSVWADNLRKKITHELHGSNKENALRYLDRLIVADNIQS